MKKQHILFFAISLVLVIAGCSQHTPVSPYKASTEDEFVAKLREYGKVILSDNLKINNMDLAGGEAYDIDLNGKTLSFENKSGINIGDGAKLTLHDGFVSYDFIDGAYAIGIKGGSLMIDGVTISSDSSAIFIQGNNSKLKVIDSKIIADGIYAISTSEKEDYTGVELIIAGSSIDNINHEGVGMLFNNDGNLSISKSQITAGRQAVIARCGTVSIVDNSIIKSRGTVKASGDDERELLFDGSSGYKWAGGYQVAYSALVIGNALPKYYRHNTKVTLSDDSSIIMDITSGYNDRAATIFIASVDGYESRLYTSNKNYVDEIIKNDWVWGNNCYINDDQAPLVDKSIQ